MKLQCVSTVDGGRSENCCDSISEPIQSQKRTNVLPGDLSRCVAFSYCRAVFVNSSNQKLAPLKTLSTYLFHQILVRQFLSPRNMCIISKTTRRFQTLQLFLWLTQPSYFGQCFSLTQKYSKQSVRKHVLLGVQSVLNNDATRPLNR